MSSLPKQLYRAEQVRELDRIAIMDFGVPGIKLMQRAGSFAFDAIKAYWPHAQSMVVFCGTGNNGGDGFVVALRAHQAGMHVQIVMLVQSSRLQGDALTAFNDAKQAGVHSVAFNALDAAQTFDIYVDALLGTGLKGDVSDDWRKAIEYINNKSRLNTNTKVIALDIPSGLQADTGDILGVAVYADMTVTFIGLKQGLLTAHGPDCCGEVLFNDLGVDRAIYARVPPAARRLTESTLVNVVRRRKQASHKYDFGHVLVIGGNHSMPGAVRMAAESALRVGAGLVSVATRDAHADSIIIGRPELMVHGVDDISVLLQLLKKVTHVAIGPGLGQDAWARAMLNAVLDTDLPLVIDADALNLLAQEPVWRENWILTPHPGEAARLLQCASSDVQHDRFSSIEKIQSQYGGCCVLKGAGSLTIDDQQQIYLCDAGNAYMASAGMGDVLTGVIVGLLAQGSTMSAAMNAAVWLHATAGDLVVQQHGGQGLLATDLIPAVRKLLNR